MGLDKNKVRGATLSVTMQDMQKKMGNILRVLTGHVRFITIFYRCKLLHKTDKRQHSTI